MAKSIESGVQDLTKMCEPVERQLNLLGSDVQEVRGQIPGITTTMQRIEHTVSPMSKELAELTSGASDIKVALSMTNNRLDTFNYHMDRIESFLANYSHHQQAALATSTQSIQASVARVLEDTAQIRGRLLPASRPTGDFMGEQSSFTQTPTRIRRRNIRIQYRSLGICSCRGMQQQTRASWLSIAFHYSKCEDHQPGCHLYRYAQTSRMLRARVVLPRLLSKVLEFSITATTGGGDFRLFPSLEVVRFVDRATSPAFALFRIDRVADRRCYEILKNQGLGSNRGRVYGRLKYRNFEWDEQDAVAMEMFLDNLHQSLSRQFSTGQSSVRDQDEQGATLLHVSPILNYSNN